MGARTDRSEHAVAVVGVGAILPDAPNAAAFWKNIAGGRYSIIDVPPERWKVADYYDPDPAAPDKTYSKIGSWVRGFEFDWKKFHIPPRVASAMDEGQQWAVTIAAEALADYGYPNRPLDTERCGVILGTAMGGERHYQTTMRISFPDFARALESVEEFEQLPKEIRKAILTSWREVVGRNMPAVNEDTMPGELANIVSGRVANVLNLRGPNFTTDAACASSLAAVQTAVGRLGLTICYDMRFAYLYRALAQAGSSFITVPAAFTRPTGQAHWHVLLRARAIETGCFIFAPAQTGEHAESRKTYGHSLIVAPWGEILADAGEDVGIVTATIDPAKVSEARGMVPALKHDREFAPPATANLRVAGE